MLRGWSDLPSTLVNWTNGDKRELRAAGFHVAESCDGRTDFDSFAFLPRHHAMLDLLLAEGIAEECRPGDSIEPWQRYRKAANPRLTGIHWCVTGRCNLNCRHCYMEAPGGRYGELPFDAMARLADQFAQANVIEISLTGGEPFARRDLMDVIGLLAERRIRLSQIYSNGLLLTDRHLEELRGIGFRPSFQVSFDGVGVHDRMRGAKGIEKGVVRAIRRLREAGFPVVVATALDRWTAAGMSGTYLLMKKLDVQAWRISAPQETGRWRGTKTAMTLAEQAKAYAPLAEHWVKDGRPFGIQLGGFYHGRRPPGPGPAPGARPSGRGPKSSRTAGRSRGDAARLGPEGGAPDAPMYTPENFDCGACREQPNVLPDGTLVPCPGYVDSIVQDRMPNLLRENLSEVWTHSFLREVLDLRKKDLLARNPDCAACELFADCGTGCRASALTKTGNLMARDPVMCEMCKMGYRRRFADLTGGAPAGAGSR